jgi:hypothetical protein
LTEPDRRYIGIGALPVVLTDAAGKTLYSGRIYGLPIRECVVIQKSIEFFNDPEPCYKHRGAVHTRIWAEFEQYLEKTGSQPVSIGSLPEELRNAIDISDLRRNELG